MNSVEVFNRHLVKMHRDRAALRFQYHNILFEEVAEGLLERLKDVSRDFVSILDLGAHQGGLAKRLKSNAKCFIVSTDLSETLLREAPGSRVVVDEEVLPFSSKTFDLILSNLSLHWINDLPKTLLHIKDMLSSGGLFLAALLGGETLYELRQCLMEAELKVRGGVSPRLSPTIELTTASHLMQRVGFDLPVVDRDVITLTYPNLFELMKDIRGMGETNAHHHRIRTGTSRAIFQEAEQLYRQRFSDNDGQLRATFDVHYLHGWKP